MKKINFLYFALVVLSIVLGYGIYYNISMEFIGRFYFIDDVRAIFLITCHALLIYSLLKFILYLKFNTTEKIILSIVYICVLYMALIDRFNIGRHVINFNLFNSISEEGMMQMIMNIMLFMPFYTVQTWLSDYVFKIQCKFKIEMIIFFTFVIFVETIQFITMRGIFDILDIILNTIGYLSGIMLYRYLICKI